jgi:hypothetical protein
MIRAFESRKEGENPKEHPPPKKRRALIVHTSKDEESKKISLLGRKEIASQEVTLVMMHSFFELSCHPLQG